jgi:hypothetical protein
VRAALASALLVACAAGAPAQDDWVTKGKGLLGGLGSGSATGLSDGEIGAGLKEALRVGTDRVVGQLGRPGGFASDPAVHIPLPQSLATARTALAAVGKAGLLDDLEARLNAAAEVATPKAKQLFVDAIAAMSLEDVRGILQGPDDSATRYFQGRMSRPLAESMAPVVDASLADVGAVKAYDAAMGEYRALPFVPDAKANLTRYVVEKGMDGIFHYLAEQEAAIRRDPAQRTTELLQKVFGAR